MVGDLLDRLQFVRHQHAGDAERLVERADQFQHLVQRHRIEADEGLVIENQHRIEHDRPRQRHAPRHATGQLVRHQPRRAAQAHRLQLQQHQVADQHLRQFGVLAQRKRHVLEHVEIGQQGRVLEQVADAFAQLVQLLARQRRPRSRR